MIKPKEITLMRNFNKLAAISSAVTLGLGATACEKIKENPGVREDAAKAKEAEIIQAQHPGMKNVGQDGATVTYSQEPASDNGEGIIYYRVFCQGEVMVTEADDNITRFDGISITSEQQPIICADGIVTVDELNKTG